MVLLQSVDGILVIGVIRYKLSLIILRNLRNLP